VNTTALGIIECAQLLIIFTLEKSAHVPGG